MDRVINKYEIIDRYLLKEIEYEYINSDNDHKIDLLKNIYTPGNGSGCYIPYELAKKFIEYADKNIILWIAKNGCNFDYRERDYKADGEVYKYPDRYLWDYFINHDDEAVRNAVYGSDEFTLCVLSYKSILEKITQIQRLAIVRNINSSCVDLLFIADKLYDSSSNFDFMDYVELNEVRRALLTNKSLIKYTHDIADDPSYYHDVVRNLSSLWIKIFECDDFKSKEFAFTCLGGLDKVKAGIYQKLINQLVDNGEGKLFVNFENNSLRYAIALNTTTKDVNTLKLAVDDAEFYISYHANKKYVPEDDTSIKGYVRKYYLSVLNEITSITAIILIIANINNAYLMSIMCVLIYSYIVLNYKSKGILITNMRDNLIMLTSIGSNSQDEPREDIDKIIASESIVLKSEIIKQFISAIGISIVSLYIGYKILNELL
jgi:hypothetical protein